MEVVIDFEFLRGRQNAIVVKEPSVWAANVTETIPLKSPYNLAYLASDEKGSTGKTVTAYHEMYRSQVSPWLVSPTSTPMAFQNANFSPNY